MTIDSHMHVGDFPFFNVAINRDGLVELFANYSYDAGMVFHPDNAMVRAVVQSIPRAYGLFWANPKVPGFVEEAIDYLAEPKFLGVKMHPIIDGWHPNDPTVYPLVEHLIERDMPMLIHCGHEIFALPWSIEELAVSYPAAKIILGHMGSGNVVYINGAIDVAARNPNVYLETSTMPMHAKIREAVNRVGASRVLYGSDTPFSDPGVEILKIQASGLGEGEIEQVLHNNAHQLFFHGAPIPPT